jgi:ribonuclease VapC
MPVKNRRLLDSFAVLAWLQDEPGAAKVETFLREAGRAEVPLLLTVVNLGEVYYRVARQHGHPMAEGIVRQLHALPVEFCACDEQLSLAAARIKADFPIALADAVAAAAAQREEATVVTGDPEFHKIEHLVSIEWL